MFDYIKDEVMRVRGIDADAAGKEHDELKDKKDKPLYSTRFKAVTYIVFSLYLVISVSNIFFVNMYASFLSLLANVFLALLAVVICVFLVLSGKMFEKLALTGSLLFVVVLYLSMFI